MIACGNPALVRFCQRFVDSALLPGGGVRERCGLAQRASVLAAGSREDDAKP